MPYAILSENGDTLMAGDKTSIAIVFRNLTGVNFNIYDKGIGSKYPLLSAMRKHEVYVNFMKSKFPKLTKEIYLLENGKKTKGIIFGFSMVERL